jgi:hypothetical protein
VGKDPIFIVGAGRSGTTLMRTLLAAHPAIAVPPETHYMTLADAFGAARAEAPADFEAFWATLTSQRRFRDMALDPQAVRARIERSGARTFRSVFRALLDAYAERHGKARAGEKTPGHFRHIDRLLAWFPDARIVAVRRDPRATVASQMDTPWVGREMRPGRLTAPFVRRLRLFQVAKAADEWVSAYEVHVPRASADPRVVEVAYEELVRDTEAQLRRVCAAIGEDWDPRMIEGRTQVEGAATRDSLAEARWRHWLTEHERRASAEISTERLEAWRERLSPAALGMVEAMCRRGMERYGYRAASSALDRAAGGLGSQAALRADALERRLRDALRGGAGAGAPSLAGPRRASAGSAAGGPAPAARSAPLPGPPPEDQDALAAPRGREV